MLNAEKFCVYRNISKVLVDHTYFINATTEHFNRKKKVAKTVFDLELGTLVLAELCIYILKVFIESDCILVLQQL